MDQFELDDRDRELLEGIEAGNRSILELYAELGEYKAQIALALYSIEKRRERNAGNYCEFA